MNEDSRRRKLTGGYLAGLSEAGFFLLLSAQTDLSSHLSSVETSLGARVLQGFHL